MKKLILFIVFIALCYSTFAQDYWTSIKTPTNSTIEAIYRIEFSANDLAYVEAVAADWIDDYDSDAIRVGPASRTYNCHNYAWHSSDGGSKRWVNEETQNDQVNIAKYWSGTSPTYQSTIGSHATKAYYADGDHSAKVLSTPLLKSKWGGWPLYEHAASDCPYTATNIQYYYFEPADGDDVICTSESYSTLTINNASYSWSGNKVSFNGTGSSVTATKTSDGSGYIDVQISSPYSGTTIQAGRKNIWLGLPVDAYDHKTVYGGVWEDEYCPYDFFGFELVHDNPSYAVNNYDWIINNSSSTSLSPCKDVYTQDEGYEVLYVEIENACGHSGEYEYGYMVTSSACEQREGGEFDFIMFPNPAESFVTLDLTDSKNTNPDVLINIADQQSRIVKTLSIKSNYITIPISDFLPGMYYVEVKADMKSKTKTLIIGKK